MGVNVTEISGATQIELYHRNYAYATAYSDLSALSEVYFTDIDRRGYKNTAGTLRKYLEDSSGGTNIPEGSVLFTDADGRATFSSDILVTDGGLTITNGLDLGNGWTWETTAPSCELLKDGSPSGLKQEV